MMGSRNEKEEMRRIIIREKKSSSFGVIFRYADWVDILLMFLGTIGAIGDGMSTNCLLVFASSLMNSLGNGHIQQNFMDNVKKVSLEINPKHIYIYIYTFHLYFLILILSSLFAFQQCSLYFVYLGLVVMVLAFMGNYTFKTVMLECL